MKFYFLILTICSVTVSCKKDKKEAIWECNNVTFSDSTTITNKITGSWVWTKQYCGDGFDHARAADKNIKVTFNNNVTFTVLENSTIITQGNWKLQIVDGNWALNLTSSSEYLYGRILFCNNKVMFNDSYRDGCDNVFAKE